jgi:methyl-accepting chemotaxis protein
MAIDRKVEELAAAEGDLTQGITVKSKDEVGSIADGMNRFLGSLRKMLLEIRGDSSKLMDISEVIDESMKESEDAVETMSATMQQTAASMADMNEKVQNIKERAQESGELAETILEETSEHAEHTAVIQQNAKNSRTARWMQSRRCRRVSMKSAWGWRRKSSSPNVWSGSVSLPDRS